MASSFFRGRKYNDIVWVKQRNALPDIQFLGERLVNKGK